MVSGERSMSLHRKEFLFTIHNSRLTKIIIEKPPVRNPTKLNTESPNQIVVQKKKTNACEEPKFRTTHE
jgi:hypothetical protein